MSWFFLSSRPPPSPRGQCGVLKHSFFILLVFAVSSAQYVALTFGRDQDRERRARITVDGYFDRLTHLLSSAEQGRDLGPGPFSSAPEIGPSSTEKGTADHFAEREDAEIDKVSRVPEQHEWFGLQFLKDEDVSAFLSVEKMRADGMFAASASSAARAEMVILQDGSQKFSVGSRPRARYQAIRVIDPSSSPHEHILRHWGFMLTA